MYITPMLIDPLGVPKTQSKNNLIKDQYVINIIFEKTKWGKIDNMTFTMCEHYLIKNFMRENSKRVKLI